MSYSIVPRDTTIVIHPEGESHDYERTLQVQVCGDRGQLHSLSGEGFYVLLLTHGARPFLDLGLVQVSAAVSAGHARLMQHRLAEILDIRDDGPCTTWPGKRWVVITQREAVHASP